MRKDISVLASANSTTLVMMEGKPYGVDKEGELKPST